LNKRMINHSTGILRTGTSGIVVPGAKQHFPAEFQMKSRLHYYSSLFNTVEINSTFYKIPMLSTFEKWSLDVPEEFRFTVKLWREITHAKHLDCDLQNIDLFLNAAKFIANKKGCLLIQFPGSITADYGAPVEWILRRIQVLDPENEWRKAVEFRSATWYNDQTYKLLDTYGASIVLHDMPKSKNDVLNEAAVFVYCRFHGPAGDYKGSYSNDFLEEQSEKIRSWLNDGKDVYAYFNNTIGNAFENAMTLKGMVEK
jgi:uncharacterized protein YecE (DUF72 family)